MTLIDTLRTRAREVDWLRRSYRELASVYRQVRPRPNPREVAERLARRNLHAFLHSGRIWQFPSTETPSVSVVIPVFNRADFTFQCLEALAPEASTLLEVIVIDNASSDETGALFRAIRGVRYIRNERNVHFVEASNQGAALARGEFILFLNSDTRVAAGSLAAALGPIEGSSRVGAVGGRLVLPDGTLQEAGCMVWSDGSCAGYGRGDAPASAPYEFRRPVDFCSGAFLLTKRELFERLGGFDVVFRPAYYEEVDYCLRLWEHGYSVVYEPQAVVWHYEFASSNETNASDLMRERRAIIASRHSPYLTTRPAPDQRAALEGRSPLRSDQLRVLWIDERIPHAKYGAGYPRARVILKALLNLGTAVTMYPAIYEEPDESWLQIYGSLPRELEVAALAGYGPSGLESFLAERRGYYDWVFVSRPETMRAVRKIAAQRPDLVAWDKVVYDAEAIFADRERLEAQLAGTPMTEVEYERRLATELSLADGVSWITTVSPSEASVFRANGFSKVAVLGHAVSAIPPRRPFSGRHGILFVSAIHGDGGPNFDAVCWFCEQVLPILRTQGIEDPVYIVGYNRMSDPGRFRRMGVEVVGEVAALDAWYERCRVFVAPTRFSSGIPLKVIEAAAAGVPAVITPLLARQLDWTSEEPAAIAELPQQFATEVARLLMDEAHWRRASARAVAAVERRFSMGAMEGALRAVIGSGRPCQKS